MQMHAERTCWRLTRLIEYRKKRLVSEDEHRDTGFVMSLKMREIEDLVGTFVRVGAMHEAFLAAANVCSSK